MSKWEWKKLGEVCDVIAGQSPQSSAYNSEGLGLEFHQGKKAFGKRVIQPSNVWTKEYSKIAKKGDILMSVRAPVGPVNFTDREICIGRGLAAIRKTGALDENFLFYYFINNESNMTSKAGAVFDSINRSDIQKFIIPVPPLSEQKRIVKFLDDEFSKIDTLKTNAETNLKNVKDLFKVELLKEFSTTLWEKKKLGEVYNFIDYRGVTPNKLKEGIPLITAKNVRMGYIDYSVRDFISESDYKKRQSRGIAHKGDILFTTEAPLGFSAIADLDVFSTGQRVIVFQQFKNEKKICNPFFNWYFQSIEFQRMIKENATGLTATGIKASRLKEIKIPLPPLSVQKEIVARLDKLSENVKRLEANYKQIIANCDELKKSILKQTFQGGN